MPTPQCENCGSVKPGPRHAFPDLGLVDRKCYDELYDKLPAKVKAKQPADPEEPSEVFKSRGA